MEYQQYYPTYKFENRDIVLAEFEEAQTIANTQSKLYGQLANVLIAFLTVGLTLLFNSFEDTTGSFLNTVKENLILLNVLFAGVAYVILRYFVELQRTIVINSRKVVTLRRMLGLDYGHLQLTLPNWRVEGATNPFVIKMFPGWLRFGSSPFWIITISLNLIWYLSSSILFPNNAWPYWYLVNIGFTLFFIIVYRLQLKEVHETLYLLLVKLISSLFRIRLTPDFENILYRGELAIYEKIRLKYKTENVESILITIEDGRYKKHMGVDFKAILRAILSISPKYRKRKKYVRSGGSTITMQLVRTLFIPSNQNRFFRKLIEIMLAFWLNKRYSKVHNLGLYLSSARFERGVNGIIAATKYFFPNKKDQSYTNEEAFFLVERLSNITSSYRIDRVKSLYERCKNEHELSWEKIEKIYSDQESKKRIKKK